MMDRPALYMLPVVVYVCVVVWSSPAVPLLEPDSNSYLELSAMRTVGYPLFVSALRSAGLAIESIPYVQLAMFCAGLAFLGWATAQATGRSPWAALLVVGIAANPFVVEYHFKILTESLFMTVTMTVMGLLALYVKSPNRLLLGLAGVAMGLAVAVRPLGYAFLPLLLLAALLAPRVGLRERGLEFGAGLLAALALIAAESFVYHAHFGPERSSLAPRHLFAKAALVENRAPNPYPREDGRHAVWQALTDDAGDVRELVREAPSFAAAAHLLSSYEIYFQYRYALERLAEAATALGQTADAVQREVALRLLVGAPWQYVGLVGHEYRRMWTLFAASHPNEVERLTAYLDAHRPLPLEGAGGTLDGPIVPSRLAILVQPSIQAVGLAGIAIIGFALERLVRKRRLSPALATAALLVLMVNGNYLLVALTAIAQPRYTLAMWPGIVGYCVFAGIAATNATCRRPESDQRERSR